MKRSRKRYEIFGKKRLLAAAFFIAVLAVIGVENAVSTLLFSYGEHEAVTCAQEIFSETVLALCEEENGIATAQNVEGNGVAQGFSGNTLLQNRVQAKLAKALCEAFEGEHRVQFSVPVGTLIGDPISSGRGPAVSFYTALCGSPTVTLRDDFSAAGINQTYHTVTADAEFTLLLTALGKQHETVVRLSVPLSQTVIVGDVPSFYAAF